VWSFFIQCGSQGDLREARLRRSQVPQTPCSSESLSCRTLQLDRFSLKRLAYLDVYILRGLSIPKSDSLQGSLDLLVLKILSRRARLHGYAIMTAIQDISGEVLRVEEGSLYPALHRMEEAGWIRAEWITKDSGKRARMYELTASGKKQLGAEESRWQAVTSAVNRVLREA
jgi:PadR family transcriptional regulator, regulatory protein PadR